AAEAREKVENSEAGVGFHRIAHEVIDARERLVVGMPRRGQRSARVNKARRAIAFGDPPQWHSFGAELPFPVGERIHGLVASSSPRAAGCAGVAAAGVAAGAGDVAAAGGFCAAGLGLGRYSGAL